MARISVIFGLSVSVFAGYGHAHDLENPPNLLNEAVRCAAYWLADQSLQEAQESDDDYDGYSAGIGSIFKSAALELAEGDGDRIAYIFGPEYEKFLQLLSGLGNPETAVYAQELNIRQQMDCNGVGLALGPKWGLH